VQQEGVSARPKKPMPQAGPTEQREGESAGVWLTLTGGSHMSGRASACGLAGLSGSNVFLFFGIF
jgi:hypothetical protein